MHFAEYRGETEVSQLVPRVYLLTKGMEQAQTRTAEAELLKANPQLKDIKTLAAGTLIVVPAIAGIPINTDETWEGKFGSNTAATNIRSTIGDFQTSLTSALNLQVSESNLVLETLKTTSLKDAAKNDPELKARLATIETDTREQIKVADATRQIHQEAFATLSKDLDEFLLAGVGFEVEDPSATTITGKDPKGNVKLTPAETLKQTVKQTDAEKEKEKEKDKETTKLVDPEKQKETERQKELDRQKELEKQKETERQKEADKQKELENQKEIDRQKELEKQKKPGRK